MDMRINGNGVMPKTTVLLQNSEKIKTRHEYTNGLILITTQTAEETLVESNYNWILEADGSYSPNFNSPNPNFVDVR